MVEEIVLRRYRAEHIAHGHCRRRFIAGPHRRGTDHPALRSGGRWGTGIVWFHGIHRVCDIRLISSTALITTSPGTVLTTSTLPIEAGRMKCGMPPIVFLSDCSNFKTRVPSTFTAGSDPYASTIA